MLYDALLVSWLLLACSVAGVITYATWRCLDNLYRPQDEDYESQPPLDD